MNHPFLKAFITAPVLSVFFPGDVSAQELRDIRGPVGLPFPFVPFILLVVVLTLAAGAFFLWRLRRRREDQGGAEPAARSFDEIARERLRLLFERQWPRQGKIKEYYSELSDIVRRYIEGRYSIRATEMTTEEFLQHIRETDVLETRHKVLLEEFLRSCDMVKFARYGPTMEEMEEGFRRAGAFVDQTALKEQPAGEQP